MNDFETQIYNVIASAYGVRGAEIAQQLGVERRTVNATLARSAALGAVVRQGPDYKWYLINNDTGNGAGGVAPGTAPGPDGELQRLCKYYLNCISLESSSAVSQFLTSRFQLKYAVLNDLKINADVDSEALNLLNRIRGNRNVQAYLGYPVRIFTIYARDGGAYKKIAPVFLYQVDYTGGHVEISGIPSVNMEVLKAYCDNSFDSLAVELVNLQTELGMNHPDYEVELDELVLMLRQKREWNWAETIDPYNIPRATDLGNLPDGIYNRPILIEAEKERYTQGLETELMTLSNMPERGYKGTALYAWIKGKGEASQPERIQPLLEVLPLNSEQTQAVATSLKSDLTVVTGPPGTGKSQVVTNLLINIAWNNKSAIFSSKNNKAVDVVDIRVNSLSKRPALLRIGNNQYASRLAEIVEGFLNSRVTGSDRSEAEFYYREYMDLVAQMQALLDQKNGIVEARNELDRIEQLYCSIRDKVEGFFETIGLEGADNLCRVTQELETSYARAQRTERGIIGGLLWLASKNKRQAEFEHAASEYNRIASDYRLARADIEMPPEQMKNIIDRSINFAEALSIAARYKMCLSQMQQQETLESLDKRLVSIKEKMAEIAHHLWEKWLLSQEVSFSAADREEMANFVAAMKLAQDIDLADHPTMREQYRELTKKMTRFLKCWAITSLSAKGRIPFEPGIFDYVIIDEASQCDIASILPLLFRAKRAIIIGDPKQLSHISQLSRQQDLALLQNYGIPLVWSYSTNSLYALAISKVQPEAIIQLKDHFRSCADIIEFSNRTFYDGSLRTATKYDTLKVPHGEKLGIRWINTSGETVRPNTGSAYNTAEVREVVKELKRLVESGYTGSIGVTTPFRLQAEKIRKELEEKEPDIYERLIKQHGFIADTVHKFQGDERDVMIFSSVVTSTASQSTLGFLNTTGNLFNVAITRARAVLVVVGDYTYCSDAPVSYLNQFAKYYANIIPSNRDEEGACNHCDSREYPALENDDQVSDWEKILYTALFDAGIKTIPQYPADRYKLDLAIIKEGGRKLDIEVDGAMYHRNWDGELCYRDQLRNQRLYELGWDVKRFWVYQVRDDLQWCVQQIKEWHLN